MRLSLTLCFFLILFLLIFGMWNYKLLRSACDHQHRSIMAIYVSLWVRYDLWMMKSNFYLVRSWNWETLFVVHVCGGRVISWCWLGLHHVSSTWFWREARCFVGPTYQFFNFRYFFFFLILCLDRDRVIRGRGTKKSIAY